MRFTSITLLTFCIGCLWSCSDEKIIELPLKQSDGYGYFHMGFGGIHPYSGDENNEWKKTYLKVAGFPENWTDVKIGDIDTDMYQSVYQNYHHGNIPKGLYEYWQTTSDWKPDTLELSKEPLKTKIAFAYSKDSTGAVKMIVDTNNNLDLSDEKIFTPYSIRPTKGLNMDYLAEKNSVKVTFERFIKNKKVSVNSQLFIAYGDGMLLYNFPQYSTTNFKGAQIAIRSDRFTSLSYKNPDIVILNDSLKDGDKFSEVNLTSKNEYIEIEGDIYMNIGINQNHNTLVLEKINAPKNQLYSTQIGYKSIPFTGNDFTTDSRISLNDLKGKYVFLDFWATSCGPCLQEMPNLKELYKKTDRDKFEIIGIVGDSPSDQIKRIIEKDSINWPQILTTDSNRIKEDYGVKSYPTTMLINPEGVVIAQNLRGKELVEKIITLTKE